MELRKERKTMYVYPSFPNSIASWLVAFTVLGFAGGCVSDVEGFGAGLGEGETAAHDCPLPPVEGFERGLLGWESRGLINLGSGVMYECDGQSPVPQCSDLGVMDRGFPTERIECRSYATLLCEGLASTAREHQLGQNAGGPLDTTRLEFSDNLAGFFRVFRRPNNANIADDLVLLTSPMYPAVSRGSLRFQVAHEAADFDRDSNVLFTARLVQEDGRTPLCENGCAWAVNLHPVVMSYPGYSGPPLPANSPLAPRCLNFSAPAPFRVQFEHRNADNTGFGSYLDAVEVSPEPCPGAQGGTPVRAVPPVFPPPSAPSVVQGFETGLLGWESRAAIDLGGGTRYECDGQSPVPQCSDLGINGRGEIECRSYATLLCEGLANTAREHQLGQNAGGPLDTTRLEFSGSIAGFFRVFRRPNNANIADDVVYLTSPTQPAQNRGSLRFTVAHEAADFDRDSNVLFTARLVQDDGRTPLCETGCSWPVNLHPVVMSYPGYGGPPLPANSPLAQRCINFSAPSAFRVQFEHRNADNTGFGSYLDDVEVSPEPCP